MLHVHFIGIGGSGMGGIAEILISKGYKVSGSDLVSNIMTHRLISLGVKIFFTHHINNINGVNLVVVSSAISQDNPEIIAAKKFKIPIVHRTEMLSKLMQCHHGIAVAGTHGKTTTTAMLVSIYIFAGLDPTFINGAFIKSLGVSSKLGGGRHVIVEADESDASFLYLQPTTEVITNIEADHMDTYKGSFTDLRRAFISFLYNLPVNGYAVVCIDDPIIRGIIPKICRYIITYGFSYEADLHIFGYVYQHGVCSFFVKKKNGSLLKIILNLFGRHNVLNAVAAIAVALEENICDEYIFQALLQYTGTSRRFEYLGSYDLKLINGKEGTIMLFDDYGHHPTELNVTIQTIRNIWCDKRLVMVFQPHRFSRTKDFYTDFIEILSTVDLLLIFNIYSAGESPIFGVNSFHLCSMIRQYGKVDPILILDIEQLWCILSLILQDNDLILMQGAGNIGNIANELVYSKLLSHYNIIYNL